jgi:lipocalin
VMSKLVSLALVSLLLGCQNVHAPLEVVPEVELDRYLGRWY